MPARKKLKLLATHSFRTSGSIFKEQVSRAHCPQWPQQCAAVRRLLTASLYAFSACRCSEPVWTKLLMT